MRLRITELNQVEKKEKIINKKVKQCIKLKLQEHKS